MVRRVAGVMFATAFMVMAQADMARPGTVNYVEGQATLNGQTISSTQRGKAVAGPGQVLETQTGKAEMLLTPGVYLRLDDHSAVRMVNPSIVDTRVELLKGQAMLEAAQVEKENHLAVLDGGATAVIEKKGIYEFRATQPTVLVYEGKADVTQNDKTTDLGKGRELVVGQQKAQKFDRDSAEVSDNLYAFSKLRSEYQAEANMSLAQTFVGGGPGWYGAGWYWDPYWSTWAFMPGAGFLYSPFGYGWGFYSPAYFGVWGGYGFHGYRGFAGYRGGYVGRVAPAARFGGGFGGRIAGGGFGGAHFGGGRR